MLCKDIDATLLEAEEVTASLERLRTYTPIVPEMDWMLAHGEDTAQEYRFLVQSALHQCSALSATYYPDDNISGNIRPCMS